VPFPTEHFGLNGIDCGDFNGDSDIDIVVAQYDADSVLIFRGFGNGTFQLANAFSHYQNTNCVNVVTVMAGDVDGDGCLDVIAGQDDDNEPGAAYLYKGNCDFTFTYCCESYAANPDVESGWDGSGAVMVMSMILISMVNLTFLLERGTIWELRFLYFSFQGMALAYSQLLTPSWFHPTSAMNLPVLLL